MLRAQIVYCITGSCDEKADCQLFPLVSQLPSYKLMTIAFTLQEVIMGSYDEKADVWSCGVMLYVLLAGERLPAVIFQQFVMMLIIGVVA